MYDFINITKALSDKNRVKALMMLTKGELCLCQLIEMLNLAPSTVSKHMSILRQAHLVSSRKDGIWHYYRLPDNDAETIICETIRWMTNSLAGNKEIAADIKKLKHISKIDKATHCNRRISTKNTRKQSRQNGK